MSELRLLRDPPRIVESSDDEIPSFLREGLEAVRIDPGPDAAHIDRLAANVEPAGGATGSSSSWLARHGVVAALAGAGMGLIALVAVGTNIGSSTSSSPVAPSDRARTPIASAPPVPAAPEAGSEPRTFRPDDLPTAVATGALPPRAPSARAAGAAPSGSIARPATSEGAEIDLLARAHDALRSRPAETLALCQKHETDFADGRFAQEREALAIEALLYLHRRDDAEQRWATFQQRYPASNHRIHLADLFSGAAAPTP